MKLLLVEDNIELGESLKSTLELKGLHCDWAMSISQADSQIEIVDYDIMIVDWMLPDGEGHDFIKGLREADSDIPIIMLTAKRDVEDKIEGLNSGCDDYLTKPFDVNELLARVRALMRRKSVIPKQINEIGDMVLCAEKSTITVAGDESQLSSTELYILEILFRQKGFYVSKSDLESKLRRIDKDISYNAIEAHISRIRKRIGSERIQTLRGIGYKVGE
jgi:DNA-binding response OmpR family regulator